MSNKAALMGIKQAAPHHIKRSQHQQCRGIGILDSLFALMLLGALIAFFVSRQNTIMQQQSAQELASQTRAYAVVFANYIERNRVAITEQLSTNAPFTLTPQMLVNGNSGWPSDMSSVNLYGQTPCVTILKNTTSGNLDALLYYVGGNMESTNQAIHLVRQAAMFLPDIGGILLNGVAMGNSGWSIAGSSQLFSGADSCGGAVSNNSLVINLDLLLAATSYAQPNWAITKEIDRSESNNILTLPGHILNTNTLKANLNIANTNNNGVILDNSNPTAPVMLGVSYDSSGNAVALGLGQNTSTITADTVLVNQQEYAGAPCLAEEVGKMVADQGLPQDEINQYLARNTLVCTQNTALCTTNDSNTCYLPSIENQITFENNTAGIQNANGEFICPDDIPFASQPLSNAKSNGIYFATNIGDTIGCEVANQFNLSNCQYRQNSSNNCQQYLPFIMYPNYCSFGFNGAQINYFGSLGISGTPVTQSFTNIGGVVTENAIVATLGNYQVNRGYSLSVSPFNNQIACPCSQLPNNGLSGTWIATTNAPVYQSPYKNHASCGCINQGRSTPYKLETIYAIAVIVFESPNPILTSVTCSNMPTYTIPPQ